MTIVEIPAVGLPCHNEARGMGRFERTEPALLRIAIVAAMIARAVQGV